MIQLCPLCLADSGRINARNVCCKVRWISKLPEAKRKAIYAQAKEEEGEQAMRVLIAAVNAEYKRRMELNKPEAAPGDARRT